MTRSRLSAVTLTVLVLLLVLGAFLGWRSLTAPLPEDTGTEAGPADCVDGVQPGDVVRTEDVTVSVYNAGTRSGLASRTQEELATRGFIAGDVGNAPGTLGDVARVRVLAASPDDPAARLVARQFGRRVQVQKYDEDLGPGVEVVVGDGFRKLAKAPQRLKATAAGSGC